MRNWLIPSMMDFFSKNSAEEYPQQVYEVGDCVIRDDNAETGTQTIKRLAWALAEKDASFTKAKQVLHYLLEGLNLEYEIEETEHASFIPGRCGRVSINEAKVAYIGEIHPQVLKNFGLDFPVAAFELNISEVHKLLS